MPRNHETTKPRKHETTKSRNHETRRALSVLGLFRVFVFSWLNLERRDNWRVIAGPHVFLHRTCRHPGGERLAAEHVIEPPAALPLPHVPPRRPPREPTVIAGIERSADVHEAAAQNPLDHRALLGKLANRARLALLWMHVALGAGDIHVAHHDERSRTRLERRRVRVHRLEEFHLAGKVFAAVRD